MVGFVLSIDAGEGVTGHKIIEGWRRTVGIAISFWAFPIIVFLLNSLCLKMLLDFGL
jgi:hypothetical protein